MITKSIYRAVLFSFITAPAITMFMCFLFLSFNNSIANSFLSSARELTGNVPADKVQICNIESNEQEQSSVYVRKEPCEKKLVDASEWTKSVDSTIRNTYLSLVLLGFVTWFVFEGMAKQLMMKLKTSLEKRKQ